MIKSALVYILSKVLIPVVSKDRRSDTQREKMKLRERKRDDDDTREKRQMKKAAEIETTGSDNKGCMHLIA